jgi:inosine-uridine nucleoside N-ribohydrolase
MSLPDTLPAPLNSSVNVNRRPILIDTDLSFDDYVALLFLLQHPAVDVRAVTVANGVVHVQPGLENAARLLALAGRMEIPLARGPAQSLSGRTDFPAIWRLLTDYGTRPLLPRQKAPRAPCDAPTLIRQQILASPAPVTFVALAPLTNLALALQADPELVQHIETIFVSGGAFTVPGTIHQDVPGHPNTVAEWNFYTDPLAAKLVFQSGARIALVPLDVTHVHGSSPLLFSRAAVRALRSAARGKASRVLVRFIHIWQLMTKQFLATPLWDAAVAALVVDPQLGSWRESKIDIIQEPQALAGRTYETADGPYSIQVCYAGNQPAFETAYLNLVAGKV